MDTYTHARPMDDFSGPRRHTTEASRRINATRCFQNITGKVVIATNHVGGLIHAYHGFGTVRAVGNVGIVGALERL